MRGHLVLMVVSVDTLGSPEPIRFGFNPRHLLGSAAGPFITRVTTRLNSHIESRQQVHSIFSSVGGPEFLKNDIRIKPDLDALGALGDAGWYCIRAILWANEYDLPKTVTALPEPEYNEAGAILSCGALLRWTDGKTATFYCSFLTNLTVDITALGTNGCLRVHDFGIPFQEKGAAFYEASNSRFAKLSIGIEPIPSEHVIDTDLPQEALMVQEFANLVAGINEKGPSPEKKWPTISRKTQLVIDAVKASIEKGFEPVEVVP